MKLRLTRNPREVVHALERIEHVANLLGIEVDGTNIVLTIRRGFLGREIEKVPITYIVVYRGSEILINFFTAMNWKPVLRARIGNVESIAMIETTCLGEKSVCREIERLLQAITKLQYIDVRREAQPVHRFSIDDRYAVIIDGLAEITLATLYLWYPLLDRHIVRLEDVKNIDEFLEHLYRTYSSRAREIVACIEAENWRLILAIDFDMRTYTPSFIENSTRIVGPQAIDKLKSKRGDRAILTVFAMRS